MFKKMNVVVLAAMLAMAAITIIVREAEHRGATRVLQAQHNAMLDAKDAKIDSLFAHIDTIALERDSLAQERRAADEDRDQFAEANIRNIPTLDSALAALRRASALELARTLEGITDTLRLEIDACTRQLNTCDEDRVRADEQRVLLTSALTLERDAHTQTRVLWQDALKRANRRFGLAVTAGVGGLYDGTQIRFGPGLLFGVYYRF